MNILKISVNFIYILEKNYNIKYNKGGDKNAISARGV